MAEVSEEENFNLKNRYRHQWKTMNFADKKRMPIHESKVADLLRNSHIYRSKIVNEIGTYQKQLDKGDQFENGLLTYVNEAAWGEMRELINDVGIRDETIEFINLAKLNKMREQSQFASDAQMRYLQNSLYTPLDMTDYEDQFVSWRELPGALPIANSQKILDFKDEDWPQINALVEHFIPEKAPLQSTGPTMTALMEAERTEIEPEEDDEDEEEGEYGEEYGEEGAEEYGEEYGEEEEGPPSYEREWPPRDVIKTNNKDNRVFRVHEKLRSKFNETEIDNFMKLLAIKPHTQWEDTSFFHNKLGVHSYEDGH